MKVNIYGLISSNTKVWSISYSITISVCAIVVTPVVSIHCGLGGQPNYDKGAIYEAVFGDNMSTATVSYGYGINVVHKSVILDDVV
jgi:hypothetical protein